MTGTVGTFGLRWPTKAAPRLLGFYGGILVAGIIAFSSGITAVGQDAADGGSARNGNEDLLARLEQAEARIRKLEARVPASAALDAGILPASHEDTPQTGLDGITFSQPPEPRPLTIGVVDCPLSVPGTLESSAERRSNPLIRLGGVVHIDGTTFPTSSPGIGFFENPSSGNDPENRLEFRRLRLAASGDVLDDMFYQLEFEFADPNNPQVLDAYIGFRDVPCLQTVIMGNQQRPLGISVLTSGSRTVFMESAVVFGESNVDSRRVGALSRGYSADESVNWQFGVFEVPNLQSNGLYLSDSLELSVHGRVTATPWYDESSGGRNYLHIGGNTVFGNANGDLNFQSRPELRTQSRWIDTGAIAGSDWFNATGIEVLLNMGAFSAGGEWAGTSTHRADDGPTLFFHGGYLYVAYFLTGDFQPIDRQLGILASVHPTRNFTPSTVHCGCGAWELAARVSYFDLTDEDIRGGRETNFTFGVNWWFNPSSRLMFNYVVGNIDEHAPVGGYTSGHFSGLAMRLEIDF